MDGVCGAICDKLYALGGVGRFFIVSEREFLDAFPEGAEKSEEQLKKALKTLCDGGYVDIRYSGGGMYCVSLVKTYQPAEERPLPQRQKNDQTRLFFAALAGGALGGIITALVSLVFLLC